MITSVRNEFLSVFPERYVKQKAPLSIGRAFNFFSWTQLPKTIILFFEASFFAKQSVFLQ
jgi:hypothetical protein